MARRGIMRVAWLLQHRSICDAFLGPHERRSGREGGKAGEMRESRGKCRTGAAWRGEARA